MNAIKNQNRIDYGFPTTGNRNNRDVVYEAGLLTVDRKGLTDQAQIDRWINEGGALTQERISGFTQRPHN